MKKLREPKLTDSDISLIGQALDILACDYPDDDSSNEIDVNARALHVSIVNINDKLSKIMAIRMIKRGEIK